MAATGSIQTTRALGHEYPRYSLFWLAAMTPGSQQADASPDVDRRTDGPGVTRIDPADPAAPMYQLLAKLRKPVALREIMIRPVREGYAGQGLPDAATVLPPREHLFPGLAVSEIRVP